MCSRSILRLWKSSVALSFFPFFPPQPHLSQLRLILGLKSVAHHIYFLCSFRTSYWLLFTQKAAKLDLAVVGLCPCFSLPFINLSAPKDSANQKQNNGTARREVKEWDNVNTEAEKCWPHTLSHTHTDTDLMAEFLSGNNRRNIWQNCPPKPNFKRHQVPSPPGTTFKLLSCPLKKRSLDAILNNCAVSAALRSNMQKER